MVSRVASLAVRLKLKLHRLKPDGIVNSLARSPREQLRASMVSAHSQRISQLEFNRHRLEARGSP